MLDMQSLAWRMACERLKDEASALEQQSERILGTFEQLEREPTAAERDARRKAYLRNRSRMHVLEDEIAALDERLREYGH